MQQGSGAGGGGKEAPLYNRRASAAWLRLMVISLALVALAVLLAFWNWAPSFVQQTEPTGISSHHLIATPPPLPSCGNAADVANPIVAENRCPGTDSWRRTLSYGPQNAINAFAVPASVNLGDPVQLYVSTTARSYAFYVYRVGWYQGHGARLFYSSPVIHGINQPAPTIDPLTHAASCANWHDPVTLRIPTSWISGVYIVKFVTSDGNMRYTLFIVRNDASHAAVLFQVGLMTYQAYNQFGGHNLYGGIGAQGYNFVGRSYAVSFDRPYMGNGLGLLGRFEGPLIMFLERHGYDVTYMADTDLTLHPQPLLRHRLLVIGGHDEYWTAGMRAAVTSVRDHGISLAFFSANDVYWQARLASTPLGPDRLIVCYKLAKMDPFLVLHPDETTTHWSSAPVSQPQDSLIGSMYVGIPLKPEPLALMAGALPYLQGTGLHPGSEFPGLVYGEVDGYVRNGFEPSHVTILTAAPVRINNGVRILAVDSNATIYTAPSGAKVFDTGTFEWYQGLVRWPGDGAAVPLASPSTGFERFTINILNALLAE